MNGGGKGTYVGVIKFNEWRRKGNLCRCNTCAPAVHARLTGSARTAYWQCTHGLLAVHARLTGSARTAYWQCTHGLLEVHARLTGSARMA